jgi:hypothetical protein
VTFLEAALEVLQHSREAMTAAEISGRALEKGLIQTTGKTPAMTMAASLYKEAVKGPASLVVKVAKPGNLRSRRGSVRWRAR